MKKALSVVLALIMIMTCGMVAFATEAEVLGEVGTYKVCECKDCKKAAGCTCCIFCPYLNEDFILQCVKPVEGPEGERHVVKCCANCSGLFPCDCGSKCGCATCDGESIEKDDGSGDPLLTPEQQEKFVNGFQKIIKIISDAFNKFFDAIFEFLRIDQVI